MTFIITISDNLPKIKKPFSLAINGYVSLIPTVNGLQSCLLSWIEINSALVEKEIVTTRDICRKVCNETSSYDLPTQITKRMWMCMHGEAYILRQIKCGAQSVSLAFIVRP